MKKLNNGAFAITRKLSFSSFSVTTFDGGGKIMSDGKVIGSLPTKKVNAFWADSNTEHTAAFLYNDGDETKIAMIVSDEETNVLRCETLFLTSKLEKVYSPIVLSKDIIIVVLDQGKKKVLVALNSTTGNIIEKNLKHFPISNAEIDGNHIKYSNGTKEKHIGSRIP